MQQPHRSSWPVVVVGAGPAGLATAISLARSGVECYVIDRHAGPAPHPRATGLSLRTMEHLRHWGLEDAVRAGGCDVDMQLRVVSTLADAAHGTTIDVGFPTRDQSRSISPTAPACVPQDHLEAVLSDHLLTLPAARVDRRTRLVGMHASQELGAGYQLSLFDEATGATRQVWARYVVGADGVRSAVRDLMGIEVTQTPSLYDGTSVVFHAALWSLLGEHRYGLYSVEHPDAPGLFLPAGGDRWVYAHDQVDDLPPRSPAMRIRAAIGADVGSISVDRSQAVSFIGAIARRFRAGDAFLVGDAAHRVTPRGGTGLNTAFADGIDLGWKMAWVLRGWSDPWLLDSYEAERRPMAEHQLHRSIHPDGSRRDTARAVTVDVGGRIRHAWLPGAGRRSTLDLIGPGVTVLRRDPRPTPRSAPPSGTPTPVMVPPATAVGVPIAAIEAPVEEHLLDPVTAQSLGILPGGQLAVRPDGVPFTAPAENRTHQPGASSCPVPT